MSFTDRLVLWLHVAFAVFAIGPVTIATMSSPRYIRSRNVGVLRYLLRMTRIFSLASLGVLVFGIVAGQELHKLGQAWLAVAMTLFAVALVLLVLVMRDQRRAIVALEHAAEKEALAAASSTPAPGMTAPAVGGGQAAGHAGAPGAAGGGGTAPSGPFPASGGTTGQAPAAGGPSAVQAANVERGRIATMSGIIGLIWLATLVLMIWNS